MLFTGGRYFRYEVLPLDCAASTQLSTISRSSQPDIRRDSLLAEVLLDGPITMWRVVRPSSTHYLLRRPDRPVLDLCERRYVRTSPTGSQYLVDGNNYRNQLGLYFADCPAAVEVAQAAAFSAAGVAGVAQVYSQTCALGQPIMRS